MKKIIYSLVIMIAASSLFTSCLEYVEPVGIQQLRTAKADYLDALAQLRLADAELQRANAAFVLAQAAYVDAMTEAQLIENRIREYDIQIKAAQTQFDIDSLTREKELLMIQYDELVADAKADLAEAEENLRVTLRAIAAVQHLLTVEERWLLFAVMTEYEEAFDEYNDLLFDLEQANARLWELEYRLNDSTDWNANFQGEVDFFTGEVERAETALANVPENLDLEAWKAELDMLQDSLNAIDYSAAQLSRDSVLYMVNTWCEANIGYEEEWQAAKEKYLADTAAVPVKPNPGPKPADPGAEPVRSDYDGKGDYRDSVGFPKLVVPADKFNSSPVYYHFGFLMEAYYWEDAPVGKDSTDRFVAFAAPGGVNPATLPVKGWIESNATKEMVEGFLFGKENTEDPLTLTYRDLANDIDVTLEDPSFIGLYGAHSVLNRHLVLTPGSPLEIENALKAKNKADSIYKAHREILEAGMAAYPPLIDSIAQFKADSIAWEAAKAAALARAQALVNASKLLTGDGVPRKGLIANYSYPYNNTNPPDPPRPDAKINADDTTNLLAGIIAYAAARIAFFEPDVALSTAGAPPTNYDVNFLTYRNKLDLSEYQIRIDSLERVGFRQKIAAALAPWDTYSEYSWDSYTTVDLTVFTRPNANAHNQPAIVFDPLLRTVAILFQAPELTSWDIVDLSFNTQPGGGVAFDALYNYGFAYNDAQPYLFEDGEGYPFIPKSVQDAKAKMDQSALGVIAAEDEYKGIYESFWNLQAGTFPGYGLTEELPINWSDQTFNVPNKLVIFDFATGDIYYNDRLGAVLSFLETGGAADPWDWTGELVNSRILNGAGPNAGTEYYFKLWTEFRYNWLAAGENNIQALARIKDWIDDCMDAVEAARTAADQKKYKAEHDAWKAAKTAYDEYPDKKADWDAYQAALAALKEAFYGVKKYDKNGKPVEYFSTDVPTIPAPVPGAIPATYESVDPIIKNWAYNKKYFGGKQLELAQKWHGDYPETLHGFYDRAYHITHITDHLDAIMAALDAAYTAATGIYQYEWEKYVIVVDPVTHEYKINITAVKKDYGENLAADLATFFDNYNKFQRQYRTAWETYLEKCEIELGYWKKLLAQFNAGYNPIEMAVKEQQNIIAQLEIKVETAKKRLELAEAEYNATIAKLLN